MSTPRAKRSFYLGRYNCIEPIGHSAAGEVFRAKMYGVAGFEKQFAIQRLNPGLSADERALENLLRAAAAAAALDHPHIARVHEVNVQGGQYYIVNELVPGLDLNELLSEPPVNALALPLESAVAIGIDLAEALAYAHGRGDVASGGVLHLGISPHTVRITPEGEAKLLDFGQLEALPHLGSTTHHHPSAPGGPPSRSRLAYLAPEQRRGEAADARADLYSLGAVVYRLVTGQAALDGAPATADAPPMAAVADPRLRALLARCLEPSRERRLASAEELAQALREILGTRLELARAELVAGLRRVRGGSTLRGAPPPSPPVPLPPPPEATPEPAPGFEAGRDAPAIDSASLVSLDHEMPGTATEPVLDTLDVHELIEAVPEASSPERSPGRPPPVPSEPAAAAEGDSHAMETAFDPEPETTRNAPEAKSPPPPDMVACAPASQRRLRWLLMAGAPALVVAFVTSGWLSRGGHSAGLKQPPPAPAPAAQPARAAPPAPEPAAARLPAATPPVPAAPGATVTPGALDVLTTPAGARVFVDGEARGISPVHLPVVAGRHQVVVLASHHKAWREMVPIDAAGKRLTVTLEPARLPAEIAGSAGLKVRCRTLGELRLLVDGADTGLDCPNQERISVMPGRHTIGLYSPRTEQTYTVERDIAEREYSTRVYVRY